MSLRLLTVLLLVAFLGAYGDKSRCVGAALASPASMISVVYKATPRRGEAVSAQSAYNKVLQSGRSGAAAGLVQVVSMMWLRTIVNYQYMYGVSLTEAAQALYKEGGFARFYKGLEFALLQGPLARFGAVAANQWAMQLAKHNMGFSTILGSILAALWRILLMPLDTCKTVLQVKGRDGFNGLMKRVFLEGDIACLYSGSKATLLGTVVSHYPWFLSHNLLDRAIPMPHATERTRGGAARGRRDALSVHLRSALIGFASSAVSDTVSNFIRVIKTVKQSHQTRISYVDVVRSVVDGGSVAGWRELLSRGLGTRILSNGVQSMLFTVIWKSLEQ